jgi:hypothetical protein
MGMDADEQTKKHSGYRQQVLLPNRAITDQMAMLK